MTIAFTALLDLARTVGQVIEGTATTGTTTDSVVCSSLPNYPDASVDNAFALGTLFLITDAAGTGVAPENETARITAYSASTGTLTLTAGDLSAAPASGDYFGVTKISRHELFQALNAALRDLGPVPSEDVSLTTAGSTRAYTIPAAAKGDLRQVWIAQHTAEPYDWEEIHHWYQRHNTATYDLVFPFQPPSGYLIRLVYVAPHATLGADADVINDSVPLDYLNWKAAAHHYRLRLHYPGKDANRWTGLMNEAAEYAAQAKRSHVMRLPPSTTKMGYFEEEDLTTGPHITTEDVPLV